MQIGQQIQRLKSGDTDSMVISEAYFSPFEKEKYAMELH
jgi:hypothetical protein